VLRKLLLIPFLSLALIASGCGLRLETEIDETYSPDVEESARRGALEQTERIENLARTALEILKDNPEIPLVASASSTADTDDTESDINHDELRDLLNTIAKNASQQAIALQPDNDATSSESGTSAPTSDTSDEPNGPEDAELTVEDNSNRDEFDDETALDIRPLLTQLETGAFQRMSDTAIVTAPLARLLGSISAAQAFDAIQLRAFVQQQEDIDEEQEAIEAGFSNIPRLKDTVDASGNWAATIGRIDRIGYLMEILAADNHSSQKDLRNQAEDYRDWAQDWTTALGLSGSASDPRQAVYPTPSLSDDGSNNSEALETEIAEQLQELSYDFAQLLYELPEAERATAIRELINVLPEMQRWDVPTHGLPGLEEHGS